MKRALISVSDKTGIVDFARDLERLGYGIISTGGTFETLRKNNIKVAQISEITGFPECLDGRVKTLHPAVHGGILAQRSEPSHMKQLNELSIKTIDMVVVNLYPFRKTIEKTDVTFEEAIENIDIGGPTMLRSAAKNHKDVIVITDPDDYTKIIREIREEGDVAQSTRLILAYKVFAHTASYDAVISGYLRKAAKQDWFEDPMTLTFDKLYDLRYGENPFQRAAFYKETATVEKGLTDAVKLHGKELSFNNINDTNGAIALLKEFDKPAVVAVKHANPCGAAEDVDIYQAYLKTYAADPISIFGGIIAVNRQIDENIAKEINKIFVEVVIAPSFSSAALDILTQKKNIRLLELESIGRSVDPGAHDIKKVLGGLLVQSYDNEIYNDDELICVTKVKPTREQLEDLRFCMKVVKHVKSNAIVIGRNAQTLGIGPGQLNRISAVELAVKFAHANRFDLKGAVMASDAFFPFSDCVREAAKAGVLAIIQPGGSLKDQDSIDECDKNNIAMIFTGKRHFRH